MPLDPQAEARIAQARHNFVLYQELHEAGHHLDWAGTALFYTALHLVDAHAIQIGRKSANVDGDVFSDDEWGLRRDSQRRSGHQLRGAYVETSLPLIAKNYLKLAHFSRDTRYRLKHPGPEELQAYGGILDDVRKVLRRTGVWFDSPTLPAPQAAQAPPQ